LKNNEYAKKEFAGVKNKRIAQRRKIMGGGGGEAAITGQKFRAIREARSKNGAPMGTEKGGPFKDATI